MSDIEAIVTEHLDMFETTHIHGLSPDPVWNAVVF